MTSLSNALREGTAGTHRRVEGLPFVQALVAGRLDRPAYCLMLRSLHAVYAALEDGLRTHAAQPPLAAWAAPELHRQDALAADLVVLHGPLWSDDLAAQPAAAAYAEHLRTLAERTPLLLSAHAYVRYLGDLSGGQLVRRAVARGLGLHTTDGLRFYDFDRPAASLVQGLRAALDAAPTANPATLVAEALAAFERHAHLFDELERARGAGLSAAQ